MTLYERTMKLYGDKALTPWTTWFTCAKDDFRLEWYEKAYDELAAERDRAQELCFNAQQQASKWGDSLSEKSMKLDSLREERDRLQARLDSQAAPTTPASDQEIHQIKRERAEALTALNRIHTAFGTGACGLFDPAAIADRAVKFIKEHCAKPAPSDPSLDWSTVLNLAAALKYPDNKAISVNGVLRDALVALLLKHTIIVKPDGTISAEALRELNSWGLSAEDFKVAAQPDPAKYEWRGTSSRDDQILYRNGLNTGRAFPNFRGGYDWAVTFWLNTSVRGRATSLPLAKAAVEAVVRAHFGDEA